MELPANLKSSIKEYNNYTKLLKKELSPAMGCTEPIAIAYTAARAREVLEEKPVFIRVKSSANIIKNARGVTVPNSGGLKGIKAAAILGIVGGNAHKELRVLEDVTKNNIEETKAFLTQDYCEVELLQTEIKLHIIIEVFSSNNKAVVETINHHNNIVKISKNDQVVFDKDIENSDNNSLKEIKDSLTVKKILKYADRVPLADLEEVLQRQIDLNTAISEEGLKNDYGLNIGSTIQKYEENSIKNRAKAAAAAGSDARMSGSLLPVVINSGSGNQGLTVSLPVIKYAKFLGVEKNILYRSLVLSNLIALHIKNNIGILSAFCGAVSAAAAAGAAITYLHGGSDEEIINTAANTLADVSGIICDGAKPSCAAKIASSVESAILSHKLAMDDNYVSAGEGIIQEDIEETIKLVGEIAGKGMNKADRQILNNMLN